MKITLNGQDTTIADACTLIELLEQENLDPKVVIVERNGTIVQADYFKNVTLESGDKLEILHFVGGG